MTLDELLEIKELAAERRKYESWRFFVPIPKQEEFFGLGKKYPERMLMAGNRNGKTEAAAFEVACHLTGNYPTWWKGYRFKGKVRVWVGSVTGVQGRDAAQAKLFGLPGSPEDLGTGLIPRDTIVKVTAGRSAPNAIDTAIIKHVSGANSTISFKTYEQGRENWQGASVDLLWDDEEPDADVLSEGLARLDGKGLFIITFTPLKGHTAVVKRFLHEENPLRSVTRIRLADCSWYTKEQKDRQVEQYPVHEREARINGMPMLGEGAVFSLPFEYIAEPPIPFRQIPRQWALLWAVDFGIDHPFAAVLLGHDRDTDVVHVLHGIRMKGATPLQHAARMREVAANVPVAWPHDGTQRDKGSGEGLATIYRKYGLKMLGEHATFASGGYSFEAGILLLETRMTENKFKVNQTLSEWAEEYGSYHRKNGLVVKVNDDLLSATRIGTMAIRHARAVALGSKIVRPERNEMARDLDFPLFS